MTVASSRVRNLGEVIETTVTLKLMQNYVLYYDSFL